MFAAVKELKAKVAELEARIAHLESPHICSSDIGPPDDAMLEILRESKTLKLKKA